MHWGWTGFTVVIRLQAEQFLLKLKLKFSEIWAQEGVSAYSQEFLKTTLFECTETLLNGDVFTYKPSKWQQKIESIE